MNKPIEGDGLTVARCEGCGGLSLIMLDKDIVVAYVCPPNDALVRLAHMILEEVNLTPETVQ